MVELVTRTLPARRRTLSVLRHPGRFGEMPVSELRAVDVPAMKFVWATEMPHSMPHSPYVAVVDEMGRDHDVTKLGWGNVYASLTACLGAGAARAVKEGADPVVTWLNTTFGTPPTVYPVPGLADATLITLGRTLPSGQRERVPCSLEEFVQEALIARQARLRAADHPTGADQRRDVDATVQIIRRIIEEARLRDGDR